MIPTANQPPVCSYRRLASQALSDIRPVSMYSLQSMDITPARSPQASADTLTAADMRELIALIGERRYAQLEGRARELVEQHPDSGFVWKVLGVSLRMQGKDALQALERTAALLPDDAEAHGNLGGALLDLGRSQEAAASYRRALLLKPDDAEAHHRLGTALRRLGQLEEAVASYRRSCAIRAEYAEAHHDLGNALLELGRPDEAVASHEIWDAALASHRGKSVAPVGG